MCPQVYNSQITPYHKYNATLDNLLDAYDRRYVARNSDKKKTIVRRPGFWGRGVLTQMSSRGGVLECGRARKESKEEESKKGLASAPTTMVDGTPTRLLLILITLAYQHSLIYRV